MSNYADEQLKASGVAQVIVVPRKWSETAAAAAALKEHFTQTKNSPDVALAEAMRLKTGASVEIPPAMRVFKHLGIIFGTVDQRGFDALRSKGDSVEVRSAPILSPIYPVLSAGAAAARVPTTGPTWGLQALKVDQLWERGLTGKNVLVGHLDSGINGAHPAFAGDAIKWFVQTDAVGNISIPQTQYDAGSHGFPHGTHTAATIAGRDVGGFKGGVAPDAQLVTCVVMEGGNPTLRIIGGMDWALSQGARIINMSFGVHGYVDAFEPIIRKLREQNVLPVLAVGNDGPGRSRSPGDYPQALSVGASDEDNRIWDSSCSRRFDRTDDPLVPDFVAPGVNIRSAWWGTGFGLLDGTSMAAPHISGLAALLLEARPDATVDQLEAAILGSCTLPPTMQPQRANRGFPDAVRALELLMSPLPVA